MARKNLYKIGELADLAGVSSRTIDYYTKLGLLQEEQRSESNYRLYSDETLLRLKRIEDMKREKYSLEEIKSSLREWSRVSSDEFVTDKLSMLHLHLEQVQKEVKELGPMLEQMKPNQHKKLMKLLTPSTAACIEALVLLLGNSQS